MKYLGIDFGQKKIGLAVGDGEVGLAVPYGIMPGGDDAVERIAAFAKQEGAECFVVGVAIPEEHQRPDQFNRTMEFVHALRDVTGADVALVDEQFSSAEARRVQAASGASASEDALAAMLILQAFFDEGEMEEEGEKRKEKWL